ncbi:MAG: 2-phosphosulfolactate phosphatase, partial [Chthoniobacterales bacterium]|nr:2-phosphosulfolactate phosphatase [Chthoniobacterales bacterium]
IDVFRAFSLACYAFANGAAEILAVSDLELAYRLKREHPDRVLLGERNGAAPPGFDFGNSPAEIEEVDFSGRTVIHTTSAGTQGLAKVSGADETITGAFVNAGAIVEYARKKNPTVLSLVCMGREAIEPTEEDTLCAEFIRDSLYGNPTVFETIRHRLRGSQTARKFFDPELAWAPERDFELCLSLDRFGFVLLAEKVDTGVVRLRKI